MWTHLILCSGMVDFYQEFHVGVDIERLIRRPDWTIFAQAKISIKMYSDGMD